MPYLRCGVCFFLWQWWGFQSTALSSFLVNFSSPGASCQAPLTAALPIAAVFFRMPSPFFNPLALLDQVHGNRGEGITETYRGAMMKNNLSNRIKNARFIGREARLNRRCIQSNPFACYDGIDGDGPQIAAAFNEGWRAADEEIKRGS